MKTTLPIEIFPIEDDGFHVKLSVTINGYPASLILDTGASRTVFDESRMDAFIKGEQMEDHDRLSSGLGTNSMVSKKVVIDEFVLGDIQILNYNATILDLKHVNQSYEKLGLDPVDGVLGGDIFTEYQAIVDYEKKQLILQA
jgi:predicted aspartyl protease